MTEDQKSLLAVFEVRIHDLIALCEQQKSKIDEFSFLLEQKKEELRQAQQKIEELNAKNTNLLTARVASIEEGDRRNARMRLSKLVREVDKCIALLNE
ncbi:hypothetical protein [Parabacteroides sp. Marseille-P3160]|uniref:hypothetical protein n=1 Tax=Parabacteroides sp. Marseille-P3160 TaxID=1917887 RepID=UPI0009BA8735|nr:hypothetical protein [Parabacteroides sp. Marseille-P3160]